MKLKYPRSLWCLHLWLFIIGKNIPSSHAIEGTDNCMPLPYEKVQWVRSDGTLYEDLENSLDLSMQSEAPVLLQIHLNQNDSPLKTLSMAKCDLLGVPSVFTWTSKNLTALSATLERVSFYGNAFSLTTDHSPLITADGNNKTILDEYLTWPIGLLETELTNLLELDLRKCSIDILPSGVFRRMPSLQRLDLSENNIYCSAHDTFYGLSNLLHLDIIDNTVSGVKRVIGFTEGITLADRTFQPLISLKTLDLSYSRISQTNVTIFRYLAPSLEMLSICNTRTPYLPVTAFANTNMKYLDVSSNLEMSNSRPYTFTGIEDSLEVLLAKKIGLFDINPFLNLTKLKILSLADNNIQLPTRKDMENLSELVILDLGGNRISNWNFEVFREHKKLRYLSLVQNNINLISENLLHDIQHINLVGLRSNSFVCNCLLRNLVEYSIKNKKKSESTKESDSNNTSDDDSDTEDTDSDTEDTDSDTEDTDSDTEDTDSDTEDTDSDTEDTDSDTEDTDSSWDYTLFLEYFSGSFLTLKDSEINIINDKPREKSKNYTFQLFDFTSNGYRCIESDTIGWNSYRTIDVCSVTERAEDYDEILERGQYYMYVIIAVSCSLLPLAGLLIWKWWYVRYFFIMIKNTALLSVLDMKQNDLDPNTIYNYDAFVSYCSEDRDWIVGELLPHIEQKEKINICLHERDFEVGVSILENIVSCMDRSRSIVLIISQQFLLSHWCQFEMHLAQHRLIETKRENLILILLEDIPRRKRPNTLHYLMVTKTYIVWPRKAKDKNIEIQLFWKRVRKALMEGKPGTETDSRV